MEKQAELKEKIILEIMPECSDTEVARRLLSIFEAQNENLEQDKESLEKGAEGSEEKLILRLDSDGLSLVSAGQILKGDFTKMISRLKNGKLQGELLVKTAKIKDEKGPLTAVDATAGLGEDSLLLAAAGFQVTLYEQNPVIYELLCDAIQRASKNPELAEITARMNVRNGDSIEAMKHLEAAPDVILLDPMFPERQKSALVKKKLQMIQKLEEPCNDERNLLLTAMMAKPKKLIVKRPPKGPYLAEIKPDYSISGKAVRFDCFVSPFDKIHKFV